MGHTLPVRAEPGYDLAIKRDYLDSANEARFARAQGESSKLYRLFDFRATPRLFELSGQIEAHCMLDASTYRASFR